MNYRIYFVILQQNLNVKIWILYNIRTTYASCASSPF